MSLFFTAKRPCAAPLPGLARLFAAQCLLVAAICLFAGWRLLCADLPDQALSEGSVFFSMVEPTPLLDGQPALMLPGAFLALTALGNLAAALLLAARIRIASFYCRCLCMALCGVVLISLVFYPYYAEPPLPNDDSSVFLYAAGAGLAVLLAAWERYFAGLRMREAPSAPRSQEQPPDVPAEDGNPPLGLALLQTLCAAVLVSNAAAVLRAARLSFVRRDAGYLTDTPALFDLAPLLCLVLPCCCCALWLAALARRGQATPPLLLQAALACWIAVCLLLSIFPDLSAARHNIFFHPRDLVFCLALLWWHISLDKACRAWTAAPHLREVSNMEALRSLHTRLVHAAEALHDRIRSGRPPGFLLVFLALFACIGALFESQILLGLRMFAATMAQFSPSPWPDPLPGIPWPRLAGAAVLCLSLPSLLAVCCGLALKGDPRTPRACLALVGVFAVIPALAALLFLPAEELSFEIPLLFLSLLLPPEGILAVYVAFLLYLKRSRAMREAYGHTGEAGAAGSTTPVPVLVFQIFCWSRLLKYGHQAVFNIFAWWMQKNPVWPMPPIALDSLVLGCITWIACPLLCLAATRKKKDARHGAATLRAAGAALIFWIICLLLLPFFPAAPSASSGLGDLLSSLWRLAFPLFPALLAALGYLNTSSEAASWFTEKHRPSPSTTADNSGTVGK